MLKKMLCLVTVMALLAACVPAMAAEGADAMTLDELTAWAEGYRQMATEATPLNDPHDADAYSEDGYAFVYDFGTLYFDTPELTDASVLCGLVVYDLEYPGLRGTRVGEPLESVLAAFRSDNPDLTGSRTAAVLYLEGEEAAGVVLRDGQRIQAVQYAVYGTESAAGVVYTMQDGLTAAIRAWGLAGGQGAAIVRAELDELEDAYHAKDYRRVPTSLIGSDLAVFERADLLLMGMDLACVTPGEAQAVLGEPVDDVWTDNEDGRFLRVIDFAECEMTFMYDAAKESGALVMLDISLDGMEAPRGVRVGDTLSSVLCRFRHGEGEFDGQGEVLYGEGEAWNGAAEYGADGAAILRYTLPLEDGRMAMLIVSFEQLVASEILIYLGE